MEHRPSLVQHPVYWLTDDDKILGPLVRLCRANPLVGGNLAFAFYFGLPLVALAIAHPSKVPAYVTDPVAITFTLAVPVLPSIVGLYLVASLPRLLERVREAGVVPDAVRRCEDFLATIKRFTYHPLVTVALVPFVLLSLFTFIHMTRHPPDPSWWGSSEFGIAGYLHAAAFSLTMYTALRGAAALVGIAIGLRALLAGDLHFHPFHPDGYYGLAPLTKIIAYVYLLTLSAALGVFVPFYAGWYGLEHQPLYPPVIVTYVLMAGLIVAIPAVLLAKAVHRLKTKELGHLERIYCDERENLGRDAAAPDRVERMSRIAEHITKIRGLPDLPFGIIVRLSAVAAFLVQLGLSILEVVKSFRS